MKFAGEGLTSIALGPLFENIFSLFLGARWGLIFSMPLAVLGIAGLFLKDKFIGGLRPGLFAYLSGVFGIILLYPEDSASYGHRHLISSLPVMALGLGLLVQRFSEDSPGKVSAGAWVICLTAVLAQFFMLIQYKVTLPYNHPEFTLKALGSAGNIILGHPEYLIRSSSFFKILFAPHPESWNYLDGMFLILSPLLQLFCLALVFFLLHQAFKENGLLARFLNPKFIFAKSAIVSALLVVWVAFAAPTKSGLEVKSRLKYLEAARSGETLFRGGQVDVARIAYTEALHYMPSAWKPYFRIGQVWQEQGNLEEANKFFRKYNPGFSPALTMLRNNFKRMGDAVEAEKMLRAAIQSRPMNKFAYDSLAHVLAVQDKRPEAVEMLKQAVRIDPNYGIGHANLAMVYSSVNQNEKGLEHLNRAIELGVQSPVIDRIKSMIEDTAKSD